MGDELMPRRWATGDPERNVVRELMRDFLEADAQEEAVVWDTLTSRDGLPHNWIYDIFTDSAGRVWVGTWGGGLGVYQRGSWKVYGPRQGLASANVTCIREDAAGRIWAATSAGLNRLEGDRFVLAGLQGNSLLNMTFDQNQDLWVGCWLHKGRSGGGLYVAKGAGNQDTSFRCSLDWDAMTTQQGAPGLEVLKVAEDSRGHIWTGTYDGGEGAGVGRWDGSKWRRFTSRDGLIGDCVYSMFEDPEGRMWFGTTQGVSVYDGTSWNSLTNRDGLGGDQVFSMFIDDDKKMWFGTNWGVSRFDGKTWKSFDQRNELPAEWVRAIAQDKDGCLWFGTYPPDAGRGGIGRARKPSGLDGLENRIVGKLLPSGRKQLE